MFGCHFATGRSALAPTLRTAKGGTKGELLKAEAEEKDKRAISHATNVADPLGTNTSSSVAGKEKEKWSDMIDEERMVFWNGYWYPQALENDGTASHNTPDAHPLHTTTLPHLLRDLDKWFPCACACPPLPEVDVGGADQLEAVGRKIGIGIEDAVKEPEADQKGIRPMKKVNFAEKDQVISIPPRRK